MIGWITSALLLLSCAAAAQESKVVVGAVTSESGSHAGAAADYRNGLELWAAEAQVELRVKDDGSEAARAGVAYGELIAGGAQVLIGPYGSAATLTAAAEAERARRVMLNAGGPSGQVHKRSPRYVFQTVAPYSAYADAVLAAAREVGAESLFIIARDDAASREMAEAALAQAKKLGFATDIDIYPPGTQDFLTQLYRAMAAHADAWIAFAEARDGADMVKTLKRQGYVPKLFYLRSSTDPRFISYVGQDAEFILGSREYDARFPNEGNAKFVQAFKARFSTTPGPLAAQAYAAGTVLGEALLRAGTADGAKLRATLAALQVDTVLGPYRVDPATGAQIGIKPVLTQVVKGRARAVADEVLPFVPWADREILK
jgi:branched-chain amino acid transport system substrate-binding protein